MNEQSVIEHLDKLISFNTVSHRSNLEFVGWVEEFCGRYGARFQRFPNAAGDKTNVLVSVGPDVAGGLVLSGHTDVVPIDGQEWLGDPFKMRLQDGRVIGRGSTDMKGFIACCLAIFPHVSRSNLRRPLHLALSYDEEAGCNGVRPMAEWIGQSDLRPSLAVIGEPSSMKVVTAHKAGLLVHVRVRGKSGHSSQPHRYVNAVMIAARLIAHIDRVGGGLREGPRFEGLDPPYSTTQVNTVAGGTALNVVAEHCEFLWEGRFIPGQSDMAMVNAVKDFAVRELEPAMKGIDPVCDIEFTVLAQVPALRPNADSSYEAVFMELLGQSRASAVAYGSEAGIFQTAGVPAIICGPGDIAQAHQPEEYIAYSQLECCVDFLHKAAGTLAD
jgi:acetylornithine deacetylase